MTKTKSKKKVTSEQKKAKTTKTKKEFKKKPKSKRKRGKGTKKQYFRQEHEDAIILYNNTKNPREREKIFREQIQPVMSELIDKIVLTFKFHMLENSSSLIKECKTWIATILNKYDPSKKSTAFSYFSVIVKNWFMGKQKSQISKKKREIQMVDLDEFVDFDDEALIYYNEYHENMERLEFINALLKEMKKWRQRETDISLKSVLGAIIDIMNEADVVDVFNKKNIYFYIRAITKLPTKDVARAVKEIKKRYEVMRFEWFNND